MPNDQTFKLKQYLHFSDKLDFFDIKWVSRYVRDPEQVKAHKFFPFIHKPIKQRRFRRSKNGATPKEKSTRIKSEKKRSISYANHLDRCVYSHYASELTKAYEQILLKEPMVNASVLAYRSKEYATRELSTPSMAKEVFDLMKGFPCDRFQIVAMDISSFFDELKHNHVKKSWKEVMGLGNEMPEDHYAVFKNITRYWYVEYYDVFKAFQDHHEAKKTKHLRSSDVEGFCPSVKEFRKRVIDAGLVREPKGRKDKMGIPQGSPISPVLANIYMLEFDRFAAKLLNDLGGHYRRYSDDILLIYKSEDHDKIYEPLLEEIRNGVTQLRVNEAKNQVFQCERLANGLIDLKKEGDLGFEPSNGFEYLGFIFNGKVVRIKSASLSKYYRKMKKSVSRSARFAASMGKKTGQRYIFKNMIFKKHTHLGAKRRLIHKRGPIRPDGKFEMIRTNKMDWGNFISYGQLAARTFEGVDRHAIKHQLSNHMDKVRWEINKKTEKHQLDVVLKSTPLSCRPKIKKPI